MHGGGAKQQVLELFQNLDCKFDPWPILISTRQSPVSIEITIFGWPTSLINIQHPTSISTNAQPTHFSLANHIPCTLVQLVSIDSKIPAFMAHVILMTCDILTCYLNTKTFYMAVCQNLVPLVNIKIAGKWMFIPLKMVLIGIDP